MSLLEELVQGRQLLHPDDRSPLVLREGRVYSASGRDLGPVEGPLNFLDTPAAADTSRIPEADVEKMRSHLDLPPTADVRGEIARAIAATGVTLQEAHLSAEARMLAERFRIEGFATTALGRAPTAPRQSQPADVQLVSHSIGTILTTSRETYRGVRVRNTGPGWLTRAQVKVETDWAPVDNVPREDVAVLNELPLDLEPGREITLMLRIRTPSRPGPARLRVRLRRQGNPAPPFLEVGLDLVIFDLPVFDFEYRPGMLDYDGDHRAAAEELQAFIGARYAGRTATLLEIGGGVHPAGSVVLQHGHHLVATDISPAQCILGALYFRHALPAAADALGFISCDGMRLPFADDAFDGVLLFAAFHHFAEPLALLAEARRVIRPGGFIYIACDCCTPDPRDPEYVMEVTRGINEQVWTLPEYTAFFRASGLAVARARIDFNSIKVFVVKDDGQAALMADVSSTQFVERLYRDVLGRPADQAGVRYWSDRIAGGESRAKVAEAFVDSPEFRAAWSGKIDGDEAHVRVSLAYLGLLKRMPDPEGLAYWTSAGAPLDAVITSLLASPEYRERRD